MPVCQSINKKDRNYPVFFTEIPESEGSVQSDIDLVRVLIVISEGVFHVEEHVAVLTHAVREAEAHVVPRAFIVVGRGKHARAVYGADALVAQEFISESISSTLFLIRYRFSILSLL